MTLRERVTSLILNTGGSPEVVAAILSLVAEDRLALVDGLKRISCRVPIMGSTGDYRQGQLDALEACREVADEALAAGEGEK